MMKHDKINDMPSDSKSDYVGRLLQTVGKEVFIKLYPLILRDPEISVLEVGGKYPHYNSLSPKTQQSRLSTAKMIFRNGLIREALQQIIISPRVDRETQHLADKYLSEL